jgi:protein-S-isoprenylcysteine O-methyltransferase Ste14
MPLDKLELKIPPVALSLIFALIMWLISLSLPNQGATGGIHVLLAALFFAAGGVIALMGVWSFRRAGTTVNPFTPHASAALVTSGIYRLSRNPMYLGLLLMLIGFGLLLWNFNSLIACPGFILYMNRFQIGPEERFLASRHSKEFAAYRSRVRRWF